MRRYSDSSLSVAELLSDLRRAEFLLLRINRNFLFSDKERDAFNLIMTSMSCEQIALASVSSSRCENKD